MSKLALNKSAPDQLYIFWISHFSKRQIFCHPYWLYHWKSWDVAIYFLRSQVFSKKNWTIYVCDAARHYTLMQHWKLICQVLRISFTELFWLVTWTGRSWTTDLMRLSSWPLLPRTALVDGLTMNANLWPEPEAKRKAHSAHSNLPRPFLLPVLRSTDSNNQNNQHLGLQCRKTRCSVCRGPERSNPGMRGRFRRPQKSAR